MGVLVGREAPDFTAAAVMSNNSIENFFSFREYTKGSKSLLFFYPLDFTFVCPSEIIAFDKKVEEFKKRGVKLIGVSIDSHFSHLAYKNMPIENGGIGQVKYPLVADITRQIAKDYDVLSGIGAAFRATFLIDENHIVRHQTVNDLPLGRNVEEMLRLIDALIHHSEYGEVCPANWNKGKPAITPTQDGIANYLKDNAGQL